MTELVTPQSVDLCPARLERLEQWLQNQVSSQRLAGASVLVGRRGSVAFQSAAGMADIDAGKTFDRDTIVRIYSMTKPVTTVAAMMLYGQGYFQLDDPIARFLPAFSDTPVLVEGWDIIYLHLVVALVPNE